MMDNGPTRPGSGQSRRDFFRGTGLATAAAALGAQTADAIQEGAAQAKAEECLSGEISLSLDVNGEKMACKAEPRSTLLDTLRHRLNVTGPKRVCDRSSCGACTVILDGEPVYSCTTLAALCEGKTIQTLESFSTGPDGVPHAFHQADGLMCGYCTPGFVTACKALLDKNPDPTMDEVRDALDGNICRCGTYVGVMQAALAAAKAMKGA